MAKRNVTYQDIARYTGFSKTTISRFFNRPESVTPEHRKQIRDALDVLDYKSNKVARILANGQTEFIGLIVPNLYLGFYAELLNLFLNTYEKYGYKFIVFSGSSHEETERRYISELLSYKVEGLIVLSHTIPSIELASYGIPVVAVEREDRCISSVNTDNYSGAAATSVFTSIPRTMIRRFPPAPASPASLTYASVTAWTTKSSLIRSAAATMTFRKKSTPSSRTLSLHIPESERESSAAATRPPASC